MHEGSTSRQDSPRVRLSDNETLLRIAGRIAKFGGWSIELPHFKCTWSDEACALHGVPAGTEPTRQQAIAFCAPEFEQLVSASLDRCATLGVPFDLDLQIVTATEQRVWVRLVGQAQRDSDGEIVRLVGAFQDIDEQRKLMDDFRQAQKMLAIGHLASGVAHDFNNVLSVILGYTDLMIGDLKPGDPLRSDLEEIHNAGHRGASLTRQLLGFSRQQLGQLEVLDVGQVISGMESLLKQLLGAQSELSLLTTFSSGKVLANPAQLELVILNLALNAREAMPGGGKLSVETVDVELDSEHCADHHDAAPGPYLMIAVTDTGSGMDAETRNAILDPLRAKNRGRGTGLDTVLGIVEQLRGHILVYSELDRGTTFKIFLPRVDRPPDAGTTPRAELASLRGTETILLVEDEEAVRRITGSILRRQGYYVVEAENGSEALLICEQLTSDLHLLITDLVMPRLGGRQLAEILRPLRPELRILYVSGYMEGSVVADGVLDQPIAFLSKPLMPDTLLRKVREVLDKR